MYKVGRYDLNGGFVYAWRSAVNVTPPFEDDGLGWSPSHGEDCKSGLGRSSRVFPRMSLRHSNCELGGGIVDGGAPKLMTMRCNIL